MEIRELVNAEQIEKKYKETLSEVNGIHIIFL